MKYFSEWLGNCGSCSCSWLGTNSCRSWSQNGFLDRQCRQSGGQIRDHDRVQKVAEILGQALFLWLFLGIKSEIGSSSWVGCLNVMDRSEPIRFSALL